MAEDNLKAPWAGVLVSLPGAHGGVSENWGTLFWDPYWILIIRGLLFGVLY